MPPVAIILASTSLVPICPNLLIGMAREKVAQEAHEAIRPSNVTLRAEALKDAERDAQRLYELIWRQFVACQMTPARYLSTTVTGRCRRLRNDGEGPSG